MSLKFDPTHDYYADLGLKLGASVDDVKNAFRNKAKKLHPDAGGSTSQFNVANQAHQILSDEVTKKEYDRVREIVERPRSTDFRFDPFVNQRMKTVYEDLFNSAFIYGTHVNAPKNTNVDTNYEVVEGEDIEIDIQITLEEAISGCSKPIILKSGRLVQCPRCSGTGGEPGTATVVCPDCQGTAKRVSFKNSNHGKRVSECAPCRGQGHIPLSRCKQCDGKTKVNSERQITVSIPAGIGEGDRMRAAGQGTPGINSVPGDLFMNIKIKDHDKYTKVGLDLHTVCRVPVIQALKGGTFEFTYLDGSKMDIRIPKKIEAGKTVARIQGKGMVHPMRKKSGDLLLHFEVELPRHLSPKAMEIIDALEAELNAPSGDPPLNTDTL